jgi:hypothetical protein
MALLFTSWGMARPSTIPTVHATALSGDAVVLPDALRGKAGVLVVGFSKESRDGVTAWSKRLAADYRGSPDVVYYEMAELEGAPRLLRGMILRSIKSSVPERAQPRFIPLLTDEAAWRALAHYNKPDDPYVLVVDSQGQVRWQMEGSLTDAAYATVKQQVEALRAQIAGGQAK